MRNTIIILLFVSNLNSFCQDWQNTIVGTFQKNYVGTYIEVELKSDSTFHFRKSWDIMRYELNGKYQIIGDTIILNSEKDFITLDGDHISFKSEKWIIINENEIYNGKNYDPNIIYAAGFLERKIE